MASVDNDKVFTIISPEEKLLAGIVVDVHFLSAKDKQGDESVVQKLTLCLCESAEWKLLAGIVVDVHFLSAKDKQGDESVVQKLTLCLCESAECSVVGSDHPLITSPGEDVILPCHITPSLSAVDMEVRWYRENINIPVHLYEYQSDRTDDQDSDYRGRTALSILGLQEGILSLNLRNLHPSDSGVYSCFATDGAWYGQGKTELIVRALGTQPSISMDSTQGEQTRLVCRSEGWSPEPEVIWRDRDGNDVTSLSNTTVQRDSQGLLSVSSYIKIKQQSNVFSCLVRSKTPKPDWESKLHISSEYHMFVN
ncbi:UNVERIFIED_CONTAM: hypothetical protein FKN15_020523 [Acipenser sinensis]